jgi:hypothetical protein
MAHTLLSPHISYSAFVTQFLEQQLNQPVNVSIQYDVWSRDYLIRFSLYSNGDPFSFSGHIRVPNINSSQDIYDAIHSNYPELFI